MRRTLLAIVLAAGAATTLSGCLDVLIARKTQNFTATYTEQSVKHGTPVSEPPGQTVKGEVIKGPFTINLARPVKLSADAARKKKRKKRPLKIREGTYVASFGGSENFTTQVATASGIQLVTFKDKPSGSICAEITFTTNNHGQTYTGTFKSIGGTGNAAYARVKGTFTETPAQNNTATMTGSATGGTGKRAELSAECKALKTL